MRYSEIKELSEATDGDIIRINGQYEVVSNAVEMIDNGIGFAFVEEDFRGDIFTIPSM